LPKCNYSFRLEYQQTRFRIGGICKCGLKNNSTPKRFESPCGTLTTFVIGNLKANSQCPTTANHCLSCPIRKQDQTKQLGSDKIRDACRFVDFHIRERFDN